MRRGNYIEDAKGFVWLPWNQKGLYSSQLFVMLRSFEPQNNSLISKWCVEKSSNDERDGGESIFHHWCCSFICLLENLTRD